MDAYDKALSFLAQREHTEKEIRSKLRAKGYSGEEIDQAAERLVREGSLSEKRFASAFIRSRLRKNPEGRSLLLMRLKEKGSPEDIAREAIQEAWEEESYIEPLRKAAEGYMRRGRDPVACLMRKGFASAEIKAALNQD